MTNVVKKHKEEVAKKVREALNQKNLMATPRMQKIVINMGLKDALKDQKILEEAVAQLAVLSGQKPVVTKAKKAIAGFKLRQGDAVGAMVTLRGNRMYDFFERLVTIVLPRVKDFRGVSFTSFDKRGNYSMGFPDISIFPEVDTAVAGRNLGLEITINTSAKTDDEAKKLLELSGMPFKKTQSTTKGGTH